VDGRHRGVATGNRKSGEAMRENKAKAKTKKTANNEENAERKRDMWIKLKRMGIVPTAIVPTVAGALAQGYCLFASKLSSP